MLNLSNKILSISTKAVPLLHYSSAQCSNRDKIAKFLNLSQFFTYAIMLFSIFTCKLIGLELFGVLQLSYFSLSMQDFIIYYLSPIAQFKIFNGLNIDLIHENQQLPYNVSILRLSVLFINNCNLMVFLLFLHLSICLITFLISRRLRSNRLRSVCLTFLKQGFITLLLFSLFNLSYSTGLDYRYAVPSDEGYLLSKVFMGATLATITIFCFALEVSGPQHYG